MTKYGNLSPTARAVAIASDVRDVAMKLAHMLEGQRNQAERDADAAYAEADAAYELAKEEHRKACDEYRTASKAPTFTVGYGASEGVLVAAALRDKAQIEREYAEYCRTEMHGVGSEEALNRATLFQNMADRIYRPVKAALDSDAARITNI